MTTLIEAAQQALEALRCQNYEQKLEAIVALDYAIEQAQKQEPRQEAQIVNWNCPCGNTVTFRGFTQAPPPRQPLTDEQICPWFQENTALTNEAAMRITRAIEAAHGIKENT